MSVCGLVAWDTATPAMSTVVELRCHVRRTASQAVLGVIGPTTLPPLCARSRTSSEFRILLDSGILQDGSIELDPRYGAFAGH